MADSSSGRVAEPKATQGEIKKHSFLVGSLIRLVKERPLGTVGLVITLVLLFIAIFCDFLAPYGMNECWVGDFLAPPSARFWFGTDNVGRDILSRVIFGARVSVIVGLGGATLATTISVIIGVVSGYIGGKFDLTVQRFVDAWMCIPGLIFMMIVMAIIGGSMWTLILVMGLSHGVTSSRLIRGAVIGIKENVYVEAAEAIGCSTPRLILRHIMPNIMASTLILFSHRVPSVILGEASLSFLGFGIPPPFPSWGGMLSGMGRSYMFQAPWMVIWPGLALAIVVYGVNMFGDAVRDILDPRLRGGVGRYGVRAKKEAVKSERPKKRGT